MELEELKLTADDLRRACDPELFPFESTAELDPLEGIIGQERAVRAVEFGLDIDSPGYNVFVAGLPGTGKSKLVRTILERMAADEPVPDDWFYVHNFDDSDSPKILSLPAGKGCEFRADMNELIRDLQDRVPKAFEGKEYEEQRRRTIEGYQERKQEKLQQLEQEARERGFELRSTPMGFRTIPMKEGEPLTQEEYQEMGDEEREGLDDRMEELQERIREVMSDVKDIDQAMKEELKELNRQVAMNVLGTVMLDLRQNYSKHDQILEHLDEVQADIVENIEDFKEDDEEGGFPIPGLQMRQQKKDFSRYKVNLVVDNEDQEGAPVVTETHPTYNNLVGRIERKAQFGALFTDFTMIRAGALAEANGGYLVLQIQDVLRNPYSYEALKRALENEEVKIEDLAERYGLFSTQTLRPQAIPMDVKVCLIGNPIWYHLLYAYDEEFRKIFKVKADFDYETGRDEETIVKLGPFIAMLSEKEGGVLPFDRSGVAALADESSRLVSDQEKLSLQFSLVADLVREASYWAKDGGAETVTAEHVRQAVEEDEYRSNLVKERIQEYIERDIMLVDSEGEAPGQINGLAVHMLGNYLFGRPTRITCNVAIGREGLVNIERKVGLSHSSHDKGVMILGGFLSQRFAQDRPLALSATLVFEQSYSEVSGDSASSTELYALLSSLADVPIRQGIAVTGSVNQKGEVQAIGGVNHKIEGFYDVCETRGLTGEQGVIIPRSNVQHLMLRPDVVEAVREGEFHIWAVDHVDQGIEILTGVPAGERDEEGDWTEGSINARVEERLAKLGERLKEWGRDGGGPSEFVTAGGKEEPPTPRPPPEPPRS